MYALYIQPIVKDEFDPGMLVSRPIFCSLGLDLDFLALVLVLVSNHRELGLVS